ncbi:hypothetical protein Tco_0785545 [Tanacetum coccineum]
MSRDCTSLSVVNNREKQPTFQCTKDSKEPHLLDISGHPNADLLIKALAITPVIPAHLFELPPSGKRLLAVTNPTNPVLQHAVDAGKRQLETKVDHAKLILWKSSLLKDPDIFSHKASPQTPGTEEPKEESKSSPHPFMERSSKAMIAAFLPQEVWLPLCKSYDQRNPQYQKQLQTAKESSKDKGKPCNENSVIKLLMIQTSGPSSQPEDDTSEKVIHESSSPQTDSERSKVKQKPLLALKGQRSETQTKLHVSLAGPNPEHIDDEFLATAYPKVHDNLKLITDERVIDDKPESHSGSINVNSTPPVIAPFTDVSSSKPSLLVTPPPINTEATTITTSLPEITPFIALQLRVARLEQEMSEVKKTDHSADVLASIRSQVPTAVDKYLGTKLDDALLKVLERHTADLIEKYSVLPGPESIQNQESEKSPKEIIRIKKEQGEEKQDSTYSIRSTDKVDLEEFDLKSALFKHMNKIKSANRNTANYHLYHALMEALIADEDAMDKEVADKVKDHKRKHDSDDDKDDDDDKGPSAGSNQGRSTKRRRSDFATSGSAQPPPKDDDQSSKKPRESDASASKQHPALTLTGWQITDTRDVVVDSSMPRSDTESEHSEQSSDDIPMQDEGHVSDLEDTDNAHIPKVSTTTWFKPIPEGEGPATRKKKLCKADLEGPAFNLVKAFHKNNVFLQYQMDECHKLLTNKVDLSNPEGHQILRNIYEPLPLGGPPGQLKAARYLDFGLEELVPSLWVESEREYDISAVYGITHWWFRRKEFYINKHSEPSDREAVRSRMRILSVISVKVFEKYGYNYLREIILRRADYQEYKISEKDFKNLHPNDFEDLFLLNIQEKLNHLPKTDKTSLHTAVNMWIRNLVIRNRVGDLQLGIESYQTKINLERPNWDAADYYFKEDYTIVPKPRAVVYRDRNDQRKLMRLNELHKFSDGTLTRVAKGYAQEEGTDFEESFALVTLPSTQNLSKDLYGIEIFLVPEMSVNTESQDTTSLVMMQSDVKSELFSFPMCPSSLRPLVTHVDDLGHSRCIQRSLWECSSKSIQDLIETTYEVNCLPSYDRSSLKKDTVSSSEGRGSKSLPGTLGQIEDIMKNLSKFVSFLLVNLESVKGVMLVHRIPKLVHVHFRDIRSDEKCRIAWSESACIRTT